MDFSDPYPEPTIYILVMHLGSIVAVPIATLAGYCILFKTPRQIKSYSYLLFNHLLWATLSETFLNSGSTPVIFTPYIAGYPSGLLNYLNISTYQQTVIGFAFLVGTAASIFHIYFHRMYSLMRAERRVKKKWIFHVLVVLNYSVLLGAVAFLAVVLQPDVQKNKDIARVTFDIVPKQLYDPRVLVLIMDGNYWLQFTVYLVLLFIVVGSAICFLLGAGSFYELKKSSKFVSRKTATLQRDYLKSLSIQMCVFAFVLVAPAFLIVVTIRIGYRNNDMINALIFLLSMNGTADTVCVLLLNNAYRRAVLRLSYKCYYRTFHCRNPPEDIMTPSSMTEMFTKRRLTVAVTDVKFTRTPISTI